jgi:uncharacterized membrane protein YobD (UPF0266 family)
MMVFAKNVLRYLIVYLLIIISIIATLGYIIFSFFEMVASKGKTNTTG